MGFFSEEVWLSAATVVNDDARFHCCYFARYQVMSTAIMVVMMMMMMTTAKIMVLITTELVIVFLASAEYDWMTVPMTMTTTVRTM